MDYPTKLFVYFILFSCNENKLFQESVALVHDGSATRCEEKARSELLTKDVDENSCRLVDDGMSIGKSLPNFRGRFLPPSSGPKN